MAEPEEEINEITESTRHALDQDADEELLPMSSTWERDLNAASKAPNVSVFERHTLDNKVFNKPVFSANTIKVTKTGEPQKPRADMILNLLNKSNADVKRLWNSECGSKKEAKEKSKKAKSLSAKSFLNSEMIILGGVPIFVFIPPKIDAKDRGIKNLDGFQLIF